MWPSFKNLVKNLKPNGNGNGTDRLNSVYTPSFLFILILISCIKFFGHDSIQCWLPEKLQEEVLDKYVEEYCLVHNSYFVPFGNDTSETGHQTFDQTYYQGVLSLLIIQFFLFLLPTAFWSFISWRTGLSAKTILSQAEEEKPNPKVCQAYSEAFAAAKYIDEIKSFNSKRKIRLLGIFSADSYNRYFTVGYLMYKMLNFFNTFAQLLILNSFLFESYTFGGIGLLRDLLNGNDWRLTGHFPRVTFCDVLIQDDEEVASNLTTNFTVQCVLVNNMFIEKLYIILWFWLTVLTFVNALNLFYWLLTTFTDGWKINFVYTIFEFRDLRCIKTEAAEFIKDGITMDGLTAIRLIDSNCGVIVSSGILAIMFMDYKRRQSRRTCTCKRAPATTAHNV